MDEGLIGSFAHIREHKSVNNRRVTWQAALEHHQHRVPSLDRTNSSDTISSDCCQTDTTSERLTTQMAYCNTADTPHSHSLTMAPRAQAELPASPARHHCQPHPQTAEPAREEAVPKMHSHISCSQLLGCEPQGRMRKQLHPPQRHIAPQHLACNSATTRVHCTATIQSLPAHTVRCHTVLTQHKQTLATQSPAYCSAQLATRRR